MTETVSYIKNSLEKMYPSGEIAGFIRLVIEHVCHMPPHQFLMNKGKEISETEKIRITEIVERLKQWEPIQYILGETIFYDLPVMVNPSVLIPRPETEELVDIIIKQNSKRKVRILDVGTGSGCIAIALAKYIRKAEVVAMDISEKALETASQNAQKNQVDITFIHADILDMSKAIADIPGSFDLIASNPPYVMESEKKDMQENVLLHEPPLALYVPDKDPLLFYRAIAELGAKKLTEGGDIYMEINAQCGEAMLELLKANNYEHIEICKDISGKDRIIKASR